MAFQNGRDLVLSIGDGDAPENFTTIGSARLVELALANRPVDATTLDGGAQALAAGVQEMTVRVEGLFRSTEAEEALRAAAFGQAVCNYEILFPNGDSYLAAFAVRDYARGGGAGGLETFAVTLQRTGGGAFTPAA